MNQKLYKKYLASEHWLKKRQEKIDQDGAVCENCGQTDKTEIHHITYDNLYNEKLEDLKVLCRNCHQQTHDRNDLFEDTFFARNSALPYELKLKPRQSYMISRARKDAEGRKYTRFKGDNMTAILINGALYLNVDGLMYLYAPGAWEAIEPLDWFGDIAYQDAERYIEKP